MRLEVINTGTELLLGQVVNTHLSFLGGELFKLGIRIQRQMTIPDGVEIKEVLQESFDRSDVLLITGGLGPTSDDVTRETVAELLAQVSYENYKMAIFADFLGFFVRNSLKIRTNIFQICFVVPNSTLTELTSAIISSSLKPRIFR